MDYEFDIEDAPREMAKTRIAAFKHLQDLVREHEPFTESAKTYLAGRFKKEKIKKPDIEIPKTITIDVIKIDDMIQHRRELIEGCALPRSAKLLILPILEKHGKKWTEVMCRSRKRDLVAIRYEIWRMLVNDTQISIAEIARKSGVDHTTVLHGLGKLARRVPPDIRTSDTIQQQSL